MKVIDCSMDPYRNLARKFLLIIFPLAVAYVVFFPGLAGPFVFDDIPNLSPMGLHPWLDSWDRFLLFLNSGNSGPTGRPLSLATFFINDISWPSSSYSFKYTNLMLHLLNGLLVMWFVYLLFKEVYDERMALVIASVCSFVWLVHPMQVSTVLYVIQRMTELSATFTFAGLITYLHGRSLAQTHLVKGYMMMTGGLVFFGLLAVFSKENGALLLLYVIVVEEFFLRPLTRKQIAGYRIWSLFVLWVPIALLVSYMIYVSVLPESYAIRPFSLSERVMTESRVLIDYLKRVLLPELGGSGLFHDDYKVSTGLLNPPATILAFLLNGLAVALMFAFRHKVPLLSFAIAWFYAGHVLESTVLPLELYFEHRNYIPMLGFIAAIAGTVIPYSGSHRYLLKLAAGIAAILVTTITAVNVQAWGNTDEAAFIWATEHPNSIRAQEAAREVSLIKRRPDLARLYVNKITEQHQNDAVAILQRLQYDCLYSSLKEDGDYIKSAYKLLGSANYSPAALGSVKEIGIKVLNGKCSVLDIGDYIKLLNILEGNGQFKNDKAKHFISYFKGLSYANLGNLQGSIDNLNAAYEYYPVLDIRMQEALFLSDAGLYSQAIMMLDDVVKNSRIKRIAREVKVRKDEIDSLREGILRMKSQVTKNPES